MSAARDLAICRAVLAHQVEYALIVQARGDGWDAESMLADLDDSVLRAIIAEVDASLGGEADQGRAGRTTADLNPMAEERAKCRARCRELILLACDQMWTVYGSGSINYPADFEAIADRLLAADLDAKRAETREKA